MGKSASRTFILAPALRILTLVVLIAASVRGLYVRAPKSEIWSGHASLPSGLFFCTAIQALQNAMFAACPDEHSVSSRSFFT